LLRHRLHQSGVNSIDMKLLAVDGAGGTADMLVVTGGDDNALCAAVVRLTLESVASSLMVTNPNPSIFCFASGVTREHTTGVTVRKNLYHTVAGGVTKEHTTGVTVRKHLYHAVASGVTREYTTGVTVRKHLYHTVAGGAHNLVHNLTFTFRSHSGCSGAGAAGGMAVSAAVVKEFRLEGAHASSVTAVQLVGKTAALSVAADGRLHVWTINIDASAGVGIDGARLPLGAGRSSLAAVTPGGAGPSAATDDGWCRFDSGVVASPADLQGLSVSACPPSPPPLFWMSS
jgi:hypothetical protein